MWIKNGTIVVITDGPYKGMFGNYEYRGSEFDTVSVKNGCSVIMVYPSSIELYDETKHGILNF